MATKKSNTTTSAKVAASAKKSAAPKAKRATNKVTPVAPVTEDLFAQPVAAAPKAVEPAPATKKAPAKAAAKNVRVTFRVRAEVGSKVFLAGAFNDWDPNVKPMADKEGTGEFVCTVTLPKGRHEYKYVINGAWCADPECADWVQNDMGTINSVKVVE